MASASGSFRGDGAAGSAIVKPDGNSSPIDAIFQTLLMHIDQEMWQNARETTLQLQKCLQVTSGKKSRLKGGWQYSPLYVVDSVVFADMLRHLQEKSDVMTQAIHLTLGFAE